MQNASQRTLELLSASADEAAGLRDDNSCARRDVLPRLRRDDAVDADAAFHDKAARLRAA